MNDYIGSDRRAPLDSGDRRTPASAMSVVITGNRIAVSTFIGALGVILSSIIFATIWLTKLDDRVMDTTTVAGKNREAIQAIQETQRKIESGLATTTLILEDIVKKSQNQGSEIERHLREVEAWRQRIRQNEQHIEKLERK